MGQPDLFRMPRKPWNVGRMIGPKAPLKPKHIWAIRQHLKSVGAVRDLAMFNIALDAKQSISPSEVKPPIFTASADSALFIHLSLS